MPTYRSTFTPSRTHKGVDPEIKKVLNLDKMTPKTKNAIYLFVIGTEIVIADWFCALLKLKMRKDKR